MGFEPLAISGAWVYTPKQFHDNRGYFQESFKLSMIEEQLGRTFHVKQMNQSVSRAGVVRGIHWAVTPPGQAKYISCPRGAMWDVVVDLRLGSPTFGKWDAVELSDVNNKSVLIGEGLGHAFLSLDDNTVANYLCNEPYTPNRELGIFPLDPTLNIPFELVLLDRSNAAMQLSDKDKNSPTFADAIASSLLPTQ